jgi:uncharacterized membrane protein
MTNLSIEKKQKTYITIATIAALIGLGDSVYLTFSHYGSTPLVCNLIDGCSTVLASPWATIFGIPVSFFGILYYSALVVLMVLFFRRRDVITHGLLLAISSVGMVMSFWFVYLQIWEIEAFCEFCILSFFSTLCVWLSVLFITSNNDSKVPND